MASLKQQRLLFLGALTLLLAVRLGPIVAANFPLGDGGLFVVMARDLRENAFVLPAFTSYNDGTIPFVYPPLGLYLLALIPGDPVQTERWLPLLYSLISVGGAWLLARELVGGRVAMVAVLAFAAMPVTWAIEGGGVTRGLGFALLLMTLWRLAVLLRAPAIGNALMAGALAGLALLAHPSVGPSLAASVVLFLGGRWSPRGALLVGIALLVATIVILPWLAMVLTAHGIDPLLRGIGAHAQAPSIVRLLAFGPSWLGSLDPILPAALIGIAIALRRGEWLIPAWLAVLFLVPAGDGRYAALAWAVLAGQAGLFMFEALRPLGAHRLAAGAILALLLVSSLITGYQRFQPVSAQVRARMADGPVAPRQSDDPAVEWYPAITGRSDPAAYFGYEWTESWDERLQLYRERLR